MNMGIDSDIHLYLPLGRRLEKRNRLQFDKDKDMDIDIAMHKENEVDRKLYIDMYMLEYNFYLYSYIFT